MKKITKTQKIRNGFHTDKNGEISIDLYGDFRLGLTNNEIVDYIRARSGRFKVKNLLKKFNKIAGCNTHALYICPNCGERRSLMYRHDVERFSDVLFGKTNFTYFD